MRCLTTEKGRRTSGNDGNQPGTTGIAPRHTACPAAVAGPQTDPRGRRAAYGIPADQRERQRPPYFSSCRAMTTRWIWLVPS
jgi:hypothetical protein